MRIALDLNRHRRLSFKTALWALSLRCDEWIPLSPCEPPHKHFGKFLTRLEF